MNKPIKVNCRVFKCKFNDSGECRLDSITLADNGSPILAQMICVDAEPEDEDESSE